MPCLLCAPAAFVAACRRHLITLLACRIIKPPVLPSLAPYPFPVPAEALEHLEYPKRLRKLLLTPEREVAVELALLRDNGEVATFNAYRVQHDNSRGPYKVRCVVRGCESQMLGVLT